MSIARATRPKRKLNLASSTIRVLLRPTVGCQGAQSVSCQKPEDQTKNNCTQIQSYVVTQVPEYCADQPLETPPEPPQ